MKKKTIESVLGTALAGGGDFSEVFIEHLRSNVITSSGGDIEDIVSGEECGLGLRIFKGYDSVYAYTNDFTEKNLRDMAKEASDALSSDRPGGGCLVLERCKSAKGHFIQTAPESVDKKEKVSILKEVYKEAKGYSPKISQVQSSISDSTQEVLIANSDGRYVTDSRTRCRIVISSIAADGPAMYCGYVSPGAHKGFEFFRSADYIGLAGEASRIAVTMLDAPECPAGKMPVIIDSGFGGVIFHEACGHGLEATFVAKKTSVFADMVGKAVADSIVTAIDDGTIENEWGSANYDDEGTRTQKNILIENGVLKGFLIDKFNARKMGTHENGASRRQSYKHFPTSRMSNTYIAAGKSSLDGMIASMDQGLYAKKMGGGSVNPATGEFNFSVLEGYMIQNGKLASPVRGASLIGRGQDILFKIDMVGDKLAFGQGMCGSESGLVPVNVGQPAIRVSEIIVGGREK